MTKAGSRGSRSSLRGRDAADQTTRDKENNSAARTASRGKRTRRGKGRDGGYSLGRELVSIGLGCLWIIAGSLIVVLCAGVWFGGRLATSVLEEIGERDFSGPRQRINQYEAFFDSLDANGYIAERGMTNILEGKVTDLWIVQPQGSSERRVFQWEHDLEENLVYPRTNPALCLDVKLGYVSAQDAGAYDGFANKHEKFNRNDRITNGIVENDFSLIPASELGGGWERGAEPTTPVSPGVLSPEKGAGRREAAKREREEAAAEQEAAVEPNDATDVVSEDDSGSGGTSSDDGDGDATAVE